MKLGKGSVAWDGIVPSFVLLLNNWRPCALRSETAYRDSLLMYLREHVPEDTQIEREYRLRGTTADIWIGWSGILFNSEVSIEIKVDLKRKTECDRLVGQLESLDPRENNVLLVLIGTSDEALTGRVRSKYADQINPALLNQPQTFAIVKIPIA